jgi:hypothetical protein
MVIAASTRKSKALDLRLPAEQSGEGVTWALDGYLLLDLGLEP